MANAPAEATYIVQTTDASLPNAQALATLGNGVLKNVGGVLAVADSSGDYMAYNLELASIAALSPSAGSLLVAINTEGYKSVAPGSSGQALISTGTDVEYQDIVPLSSSILTYSTPTGMPNGRQLDARLGITITDIGAPTALYVEPTGYLADVAQLATSGFLVNTGSGITTRFIESSDGSVDITNGTGVSGNVDLQVIADTSIQKVGVQFEDNTIATRSNINFLEGDYVEITVTDNGLNNSADVEISVNPSAVEGAMTWNTVSSSQGTIPNNGYIVQSVGLITLTLPSTCEVGKRVRIAGSGAGGWAVAQGASQKIYLGNATSTAGVSGGIASTHGRDCVELLCTVANSEFIVLSSIGNITIT